MTPNGADSFGNPRIQYGKRLCLKILQQRAASFPDKPFVILPKNDDDLEDGFRAVSHAEVIRAIDRTAIWLVKTLGCDQGRRRFAYIGANDYRYQLLVFAAWKTGHEPVILLPYNTLDGQLRLLQATNCYTIISSVGSEHVWDGVRESRPELAYATIPSLLELLDGPEIQAYPYEKTYDEVKDDVAFVIQTSGTTGNPKPVPISHQVLCKDDRITYRLDDKSTAVNALQALCHGQKLLLTFPLSWGASLFMTVDCAIFWDFVPVLLPANAPRPLDPHYMDRVHQISPATAGFYVPDFLHQLSRTPEYISRLSTFSTVIYAGAPLDKATGDAISKYTRVQSLLGSTEIGGTYPILLSDDKDDWQWLHFLDDLVDPKAAYGCTLEHFTDDLYEFVMHRQEDLVLPIFAMTPGLTKYQSKDLWRNHPTKEGYWQPAGRADDFVKLASLTKFNAVEIESAIEVQARGLLAACVVGGDDRSFPFALVQFAVRPQSGRIISAMDEVWEAIEVVNEGLVEEARLRQELVLVTTSDRPLGRTVKGTVERKKALASYQKEIDAAFRLLRA